MSSSGLIYAVIVGAWAAYLVPMWLRRQDELNEARPTERFSTAIRLLSGRAGMERRYAKDLKARAGRTPDSFVHPADVTDSVDVRGFAMPPGGAEAERPERSEGHEGYEEARRDGRRRDDSSARARRRTAGPEVAPGRFEHDASARAVPEESGLDVRGSGEVRGGSDARGVHHGRDERDVQDGNVSRDGRTRSEGRLVAGESRGELVRRPDEDPRARARRSQLMARRRRAIMLLFLAFTLGAAVAAMGGVAFLWAPLVPAGLLTAYILHLRTVERRRYAYVMDRRHGEEAARRLRERHAARRPQTPGPREDQDDRVAGADRTARRADPERSKLAAGRRALVEQTDHAEWVDQQRERPGAARGESWEPVPVPLPTYVTAPVAPRANGSRGPGPDTWSSARSGTDAGRSRVAGGRPRTGAEPVGGAVDPGRPGQAEGDGGRARPSGAGEAAGQHGDVAPGPEPEAGSGRSDARRAASARRARERGRTPLFDQFDEDGRPRAANE